ncbi:NUDIX domain-containing protein [Halorubellus sp. JP-L1]|uniref:NUDIX domain-containing protein n=1 Tax=Halorubellus sp. JP-L1 TaxID=2715753 RepID=UPI00140A3FFA|nr:NUDIX domain-containing protein [Halorubellus sp. JP-L1]NHN43091.1 NUDIX domain-containing protein [Halorubellus sp. JP-L1]
MSHSHDHDRPDQRRPVDGRNQAANHAANRPVRSPSGPLDAATTVRKVCAYVTRNQEELLVFDGPGHDDPQVPKGTIEGTEPPPQALHREVREESGLTPDDDPTHVATDVWTRRHHPPRHYLRHFYHVSVDEPRDAWTHTVTGDGPECGAEFAYSWLELDEATDFALDLHDYVPLLRERL